MSDTNSINDEQKAQIQSWADDGDDLSTIQKKLAEELDVNVTYMEVRFLLGDLGIKMPVKEKPVADEPEEDSESPGAEGGPGEETDDLMAADAEAPVSPLSEEATGPGAPTSVKVTMSEVLPPGALAGGTVIFSDGVQATWNLNQMGQLSLDGADPSYRPSEADLQSFQEELQKLAQQQGM